MGEIQCPRCGTKQWTVTSSDGYMTLRCTSCSCFTMLRLTQQQGEQMDSVAGLEETRR